MEIIVTKLLSFFAYPFGLFSLLLLVALFCRVTGSPVKARLLLLTSILLIFISASPQSAYYLTRYLERQYPPVAIADTPAVNTVVMLGGMLAPPVGPRIKAELVDSSDRLLHTGRLLKQGKGQRVYLTGGNVFEGYLAAPESEYARVLLIEWGVPDERIFIGAASRTTYENALETKRFLQARGEIGQTVILVTSATHMARSVETFIAAGINVIASPTDIHATPSLRPEIFSWLPSAQALDATTRAWHELIGLWYYRLRGWAKKP